MDCRAEKPPVKEESESDNDSYSPRRHYFRRKQVVREESDPPKFILKPCTVVIKRTGFIEKAVKKGHRLFTQVLYKSGNRQWKTQI